MMQDHTAAINESQGIVKSMSSKNNPVVMMGYSASYGGFVHEFINPDIHWKRSGSGAKWFQAALYNKKDSILKIIGDNARIKR
jgi:hypothetical protein